MTAIVPFCLAMIFVVINAATGSWTWAIAWLGVAIGISVADTTIRFLKGRK